MDRARAAQTVRPFRIVDLSYATTKGTALNADPAAQLRLLDLQALDLSLDQLAHRRATLPEVAELESLRAERDRLRDAHVIATAEVNDLEQQRRRADAEVEQVRDRKDRDQARLDSGQATAKELASLQSEIESLTRRQSVLEDAELEIMEQLEQATGRTEQIAAELEQVEARVAEVEAARDAAWAQIDAESTAARAERASVAERLPDDLLALYEKIRAERGGIGAAALRQRRCEGCRIQIDAAELTRIRRAAPEEVIRHEECRRILVRTADSGL